MDITMCLGVTCPTKATCERYTTKPVRGKAYFVRTPYSLRGGCEYYLEPGNWVSSYVPPYESTTV